MINIQPLQPSTINLTNLRNLTLALFFQGGLQKRPDSTNTTRFDKHDELRLRLYVWSKSAVFDSDQFRFYDITTYEWNSQTPPIDGEQSPILQWCKNTNEILQRVNELTC